jgi:MFS family permease
LFRAAIAVQFIGFAGFAGALFILPLLLQAEMGLSPLQSGLTTFPQAIGVAMMVQPVGRLYHRLGPRRMMMVGMAGAAMTTLSFLLVDLETSQWWIRLIMLVRGWFFAFTLVTLPAAAYATITSEETGRATAIFNTGQQVGSSFGVALLATVLSNRLIYHHSALGVPGTQQSALLAFHEAFIAASVLVALAVAFSLFIDDKEAASTMRQASTASASQEALAARTDRPDA